MADEKNLNEISGQAEQGAAEEIKEKAEDAADAVKDAVENAAEGAENIAEGIKEKAEDIAEEIKETAQEIVEDIKETAEDIIDGVKEKAEDAADAVKDAIDGGEDEPAQEAQAPEEMSEVDRAVAEALAERDAQDARKKADRNKKLRVAGIIAGAVIIVGGIVLSGFVSRGSDGGVRVNSYGGWLPKLVNKYNHMGYVDVTGNTIGDIAESMGMSVADFKDQFGMPEDMPASTNEMAAMYMLPAKNYGEMYGLDFASMKDILHIPDTTEDGEEITEDTLWGVVQGEIKVSDYVGDTGDGEAVKSFKEEFGFGDEVTGDTKWKEVRNAVDEANRQTEIERKKAENEPAEEADDTAADDTAADESADGAAADSADAQNAEQ